MLLPRYSLRTLLGVMAVLAPICLLIGFGVRGNPWAAAIGVGFLGLGVSLLVYGALFFVIWLISGLSRPKRRSLEAPSASQQRT